jgi:beta-glucosidase
MGHNGDNAGARQQRNITVDYNIQGVKVGYKWFQAEHKTPLFAFGHGLSYTTFRYSDLKVAPDGSSVSLKLENSGDRPGDEITQVYATLPEASGEPFRRLVGFSRVHLAPHQVTTLTINTEAGTASDDLPLHATATLR